MRQSLELEQRQGGDDASSAVALARYFLAEHLSRMSSPSAALEVLVPSLVAGSKLEGLLCTIQAECLAQLGRIDEARIAAQRALDRAASPEQRENIAKRLAAVSGQIDPSP